MTPLPDLEYATRALRSSVVGDTIFSFGPQGLERWVVTLVSSRVVRAMPFGATEKWKERGWSLTATPLSHHTAAFPASPELLEAWARAQIERAEAAAQEAVDAARAQASRQLKTLNLTPAKARALMKFMADLGRVEE